MTKPSSYNPVQVVGPTYCQSIPCIRFVVTQSINSFLVASLLLVCQLAQDTYTQYHDQQADRHNDQQCE